MSVIRKFTRMERLTLIDLRVPGEDWEKGRVTMMFQRIVSTPAMMDLDDDIDTGLAFGEDFFLNEWDSDEAFGGDSEQ